MRHSPGPWRAILDEKPDALIEDSAGLEIARVFFDGAHRDADARLIAAAPELLQLLKQGMVFADSFGSDAESRFLNAARVLIARIEGAE